jgi:hypothetical protein
MKVSFPAPHQAPSQIQAIQSGHPTDKAHSPTCDAVEHNIKPSASSGRRTRRVDMSSFNSFLSQLSTQPGPGAPPEQQHNNPHATPTPVDAAALFRLVQDQFRTLLTDAPPPDLDPNNRRATNDADSSDDEEDAEGAARFLAGHRRLLQTLYEALEADIASPPKEISGLQQEDLDTLDRVPKARLDEGDRCPICAECFLDDKYPLVVRLPCHASHRFDLECVAPWLQSKGTCPMCRKDLRRKKRIMEVKVNDDEDDGDMLYG